MMKLLNLIVIIIAFLAPSLLFSQDVKVINDLRSRTSLSVSKRIFKDFEIFSEFELGLEENISKLGKLQGEIGINYSPIKFLDIEAKYRYTKNRKNYSTEYKYTNLIALAADAKYKIKDLKLYYRLQFQSRDDESLWNGTDDESNVYKNRLKLKYNVKRTKLTPYLSSEVYVQTGINGIDATKLKTKVGLEYPVSKVGTIKLYYRNDRELADFIPFTYHTIGFSCNFKFK